MLDIKEIRSKPDLFKQQLDLRSAGLGVVIDEILSCDEQRRKLETQKQELQAQRKQISKQIGQLKQKGEDSSEIEATVRGIGDEIKAIEEQAQAASQEQEQLLLNTPNIPHLACVAGASDADNVYIRSWGEKLPVDEPEDHVQIATRLGLIDFEGGVRLSGSGFVAYRGKGAKLQRALIQFLLDLQTEENGYEEVNVPHMVLAECMQGTGQLPKFGEDMYAIKGEDDNEAADLFLIPTAEVPVTNLYREHLLSEDQLPIKMTAHTPCFRQEAGAAGKVNRGIIRLHQFEKVELVQIVKPQDSDETLEILTGHAESALQKLGLHYQVVELCSGDLGFSAQKTYDLEVWAPGQGQYLEISSCSNFGDYQARRMRLRYKDEDGNNQFCHTLNGSGLALPRLMVAVLEQGQQENGSIKLPQALVPYFGTDTIR